MSEGKGNKARYCCGRQRKLLRRKRLREAVRALQSSHGLAPSAGRSKEGPGGSRSQFHCR